MYIVGHAQSLTIENCRTIVSELLMAMTFLQLTDFVTHAVIIYEVFKNTVHNINMFNGVIL